MSTQSYSAQSYNESRFDSKTNYKINLLRMAWQNTFAAVTALHTLEQQTHWGSFQSDITRLTEAQEAIERSIATIEDDALVQLEADAGRFEESKESVLSFTIEE